MPLHAWFHPDLDLADERVGRVTRSLARVLATRSPLHANVKALRGPWPGTHRLKFAKKERALFSWHQSDGGRVAWVHEIDWRSDVYERDVGIARAESWAGARDAEDLERLSYCRVDLPTIDVTDEPADPPEILPVLSRDQSRFVNALLPLQSVKRDRGTFVRLGEGPPGSGKTVVAIDAARDAQWMDYDVLVLVPSSRLLRTYRDAIGRASTVEGTSFAAAPVDQASRVWVERVGDFFSAFAPSGSAAPSVLEWWSRALQLPALSQWRRGYPCSGDARFAQMVDATLFDRQEAGLGRKDALAKQDGHMRQAVEALSDGQQTALAAFKRKAGVKFSWEQAKEAEEALVAARPGRSLLVLVDEAQDLVPEQWRTLVRAAYRRRKVDGQETGVALLGDENQRISPTAFAWSEVKSYVASLGDELRDGIGVDHTTLAGSYRVSRPIARVANVLVEGSDEGARHAPVASLGDLDDVGEVVICPVARPGETLAQEVDQLVRSGVPEAARLVVLNSSDSTRHPLIDALSVEEAKGLEWDSVIVSGLFGREADYNERTRAYTRLTRARRHVVLLVSIDDWAWLRPKLVRGNGGTETLVVPQKELGLRLRACLDTSTVAERQKEALERIENVLERAELDGAGFPGRVIDLVVTLVPGGGGGGIPELVDAFLEKNPTWEPELRAAATSPVARVAAALVAGDAGEALALAERLPDLEGWREALSRIVALGGPIAQASLELHRQSAPDLGLETLVRGAFRQRLAGALGRSCVLDLPPAEGMRPRRLAARVRQAVHDERAESEREALLAAARARRQIVDSERRLYASINDDPSCQAIRNLESRLVQLENLFKKPEAPR